MVKKSIWVILLISFGLILASCNNGQTDMSNNQPTQGSAKSGNQAQDSNAPTLRGGASEVVPSSKFQGYKTYKNYRFGYSLDYPDDFIRTRAAANGDGIELASPDKRATLIVSGGGNGIMKIKDFYDLHVKNIKGELGYNIIRSSWYVLTWKENGKINYAKEVVETNYHYGFTFSYPEDQKSQYDDVVERLEESFQGGVRSGP